MPICLLCLVVAVAARGAFVRGVFWKVKRWFLLDVEQGFQGAADGIDVPVVFLQALANRGSGKEKLKVGSRNWKGECGKWKVERKEINRMKINSI